LDDASWETAGHSVRSGAGGVAVPSAGSADAVGEAVGKAVLDGS
jgi:hypothetical protein